MLKMCFMFNQCKKKYYGDGLKHVFIGKKITFPI